MVIAYHLIWMGYGWWLPNDPRGSMSSVIRRDILTELGELHFGRKRVQPCSREIREFYARAKELLMHPLLNFGRREFDVIGRAFGEVMVRCGYTCYACAVMPDHVHLLMRKHRDCAEEMIANLQEHSAVVVRAMGGAWGAEHPVWGGPGWKVFLDSRGDIERTIRYVEDNPIPYRLPRQRWEFVTPYDGWEPPKVRVVRRR